MQPAPALMEVRIFIVFFLDLRRAVTLDDNRRGKLTFHVRSELVKIALIPMSRSWKYAKWTSTFKRGHTAFQHQTPTSSGACAKSCGGEWSRPSLSSISLRIPQ